MIIHITEAIKRIQENILTFGAFSRPCGGLQPSVAAVGPFNPVKNVDQYWNFYLILQNFFVSAS